MSIKSIKLIYFSWYNSSDLPSRFVDSFSCQETSWTNTTSQAQPLLIMVPHHHHLHQLLKI